MSRFNELLQRTPQTTTGIIALCVILHVVTKVLLDLNLRIFTLCPQLVIYRLEIYRIATSALFHGNIMHLAMNMMTTLAIGSLLEKRFGTFRLLLIILWSILLTGILYIGIALFLAIIIQKNQLMRQHSVGFSGVIFHLSVLESNLGTHQSRSVFGFFDVPSYLYPWVLLVGLQIFMPGLSFTGHLVGILVGTLQLYGGLNWILWGEERLKRVDNWSRLDFLTRQHNFCPTTAETGCQVGGQSSSLMGSVRQGSVIVRRFLFYVLAGIQSILFSSYNPVNTFEDEDDWDGLPLYSDDQSERGEMV
ncbi:predicted protein [Phaeodactylum tricornutum CCAP 1055/1]|jgi:rhomboid domain-containing protein 1|uniref:Peptidase S54 rhomboid domain-containing protein n=2 Tax=Phaeodactylum tricornutum TaxID=2850 RepID=B7FT28_PHATC|nr:predicted protein [Phaeodactylum tricornutum CCAP 1055/1]EEC50578.1 predicted protein [Phaeodactylum tricornutum CCAP 1055/1]|eukprot:XP_002177764.1 predicted protein [Phaeodactylum tricornutum CCAP 1055/1]